ncbi:SMC-Scp complex subunit ScpB [Nanoarchaeota archaeon]
MDKKKDNEGVVEATLFISGRFLTKEDLVMFTGINPISLEETLKKLEDKYQEDNGALHMVIRNGLYKMDIKPGYAWLTNKLASGSSEFTKAEQETLAIIAYKQPITQALVVRIRGNKGYDHVRKLIDVGLIKGKRVGHTLELRLDETFYNYFDLKNKERIKEKAKEGGVKEEKQEEPQEVKEESKEEVKEEPQEEEKEEPQEETPEEEEKVTRTNMQTDLFSNSNKKEEGQDFGDMTTEP